MTREERLRIIDKGKSQLTDDRLMLAYTLLDEKKRGTHMGCAIGAPDSATQHEYARRAVVEYFTNARDLVDRLQIPCAIKEPYENSEKIWRFQILCARNAEDLRELERLDGAEGVAREFGVMMGYPQTAVEAFMTPEMVSPDEYREIMKRNEELYGFLDFRPSRTHLKEELAFVRRRKELIEKNCPRLYAQIRGGIQPWLRYFLLKLRKRR